MSEVFDDREETSKASHSHFIGLDITNVTFVTRNRSTHSDVMSTVTSLVQPADPRLGGGLVAVSGGKRAARGKPSAAASSVGLSLPAAKLNRELMVERKLFMERLYRERLYRAQVEDGAATMAQAALRSWLCRRRLQRLNGPGPNQNPAEDETTTSAPGGDGLGRGDKALLSRKEEIRIRKNVTQLQRATDRVLLDAGVPQLHIDGLHRGGRRRRWPAVPKKRQNRLAVRLQQVVRGFLARRHYQVLSLYHEEERRREAITVIQARYRAYQRRQRMFSKEHDAMTRAAITIQANVRRLLEHRYVAFVKDHLRRAVEELGAAVRLQKLLRFRIARQRMVQRRMERASIVVQSSFRGYFSRASFKQRQNEVVESAIKIQSSFRARNSRVILERLKAESQEEVNNAAIKVQAMLRGTQARVAIENKRQSTAATRIQAKVRQRCAHNKVNTIRHEQDAAFKIQARFRKYSQASEAEGEGSAAQPTASDRAEAGDSLKDSEQTATRTQLLHRGQSTRRKRSAKNGPGGNYECDEECRGASAPDHMAPKPVSADEAAQPKQQSPSPPGSARSKGSSKEAASAATQIQRSMRVKYARTKAASYRDLVHQMYVKDAKRDIADSIANDKVRLAERPNFVFVPEPKSSRTASAASLI